MREPPQAIITGDFHSGPFQSLFGDCSDIECMPFEALTSLHENPELLVVCQSRRGSLPASTCERLIQQFPLSVKVLLLGSECEGERRSGVPHEGWHRKFWYQWLPFWDTYSAAYQHERAHPFQMPATATDGDLMKGYNELLEHLVQLNVDICLISRWNAEHVFLEELFSQYGAKTVAVTELKSADVVVVSLDSLDHKAEQMIERLQSQSPQIPIVVILNFPRIQEFQRAKELGVAALVGRPFVNLEFLYTVQQQVDRKFRVGQMTNDS